MSDDLMKDAQENLQRAKREQAFRGREEIGFERPGHVGSDTDNILLDILSELKLMNRKLDEIGPILQGIESNGTSPK